MTSTQNSTSPATKTLTINARRFGSARSAIANAKAGREPSAAIRLQGENLVVRQAEADRLAAAWIEFAYLGEVNKVETDGEVVKLVVTVPIN